MEFRESPGPTLIPEVLLVGAVCLAVGQGCGVGCRGAAGLLQPMVLLSQLALGVSSTPSRLPWGEQNWVIHFVPPVPSTGLAVLSTV